jgi:hypothetical protein
MDGVDRLYNEDQICWGKWRARANMYVAGVSEGHNGAIGASKTTATASFALP